MDMFASVTLKKTEKTDVQFTWLIALYLYLKLVEVCKV